MNTDDKMEETLLILTRTNNQVSMMIRQDDRRALRRTRSAMIEIADLSRDGLKACNTADRDRHVDQTARILVKALDLIARIDFALL